MRKNVKILGIGQPVSGTSTKNGRPYAFTPVSFAYTDDRVNGYRAETCNFDSAMVLEHGGLKVNDQVDLVFHFQNFRPVVDAIL